MSRILGFVADDVAEREDLEMKLRSCRQHIHALEEQRERIQRDMHDGILQTLYSAALAMAASKSLLPTSSTQAAELVDHAAAQLDCAIRQVREFLNPDSGARHGHNDSLELQMRALIQSMTGPAPVTCRIVLDAQAVAVISEDHHNHLLCILRESLSNVVRHAAATFVTVSCLFKEGGLIALEIKDDGAGFTYPHTSRRHHGLKNLMARAKDMGGELRVSSIPGQGTRLVLQLPGPAADRSERKRA